MQAQKHRHQQLLDSNITFLAMGTFNDCEHEHMDTCSSLR